MADVGRYGSTRTSRSVFGVFVALMASTTALTFGPSLTGASAAPSTLHAKVTRVSPALAAYNPQLASAGIPVEEVTFAVRPLPVGNHFACTITVRHRRRLIGRTQANFGGPWDFPSSADLFSVQVEIGKRTFKASPSDASVKCHT